MFYNRYSKIGFVIEINYFINNAGTFLVDSKDSIFLP
jgi:hypothetical protein